MNRAIEIAGHEIPAAAVQARRGHAGRAVDDVIGARLRTLRCAKAMTQSDLAQLVGITYQQIHKYERGHDRIAASRLYDLARALDVMPSHFFPPPDTLARDQSPAKTYAKQRVILIARAAAKLKPRWQKAVLKLAQALSEDEDDAGQATE